MNFRFSRGTIPGCTAIGGGHQHPINIPYMFNCMVAYLLGAMPTAPGFSELQIFPKLCDLTYAEAAILLANTENVAFISCQKCKNGTTLFVDLPPEVQKRTVVTRDNDTKICIQELMLFSYKYDKRKENTKMNTIQAKPLTEQSFAKFGRYGDILNPVSPFIGETPIQFYRDILPLHGSVPLSASTTCVAPMELIVKVMEYHTATPEIVMMLDDDAIICVGPATADKNPPIDQFEAFYLPKGVMVYLHPGVWHYAPFPLHEKMIHSLVLLPERTYANDCVNVEIDKEHQVKIKR